MIRTNKWIILFHSLHPMWRNWCKNYLLFCYKIHVSSLHVAIANIHIHTRWQYAVTYSGKRKLQCPVASSVNTYRSKCCRLLISKSPQPSVENSLAARRREYLNNFTNISSKKNNAVQCLSRLVNMSFRWTKRKKRYDSWWSNLQ